MKPTVPLKVSAYLAPRFWSVWVLIGLLRIVAFLPLSWLVLIGGGVGDLYYWLSPRRRKIAEINLKIAFPDADAAEIRSMSKACFRNLGVAAFELGLTWWRPERVISLCEVEGLEHLHAAARRGKGVIILTAHFTCLEVGGPLINQQVPLQAMYKRPHNELFGTFMRRGRARYTHAIVEYHKPIALIKGLKKGHATWYAPDQDFGAKDTVFVPFFGVQATALTAPARIAKISGAAVVPYYIARKADASGYRMVFLPALEDFPSGDAVADARLVNRVIEDMIMRNPRQYLWVHQRYKNRPDGRRGMYPPFVEQDSALP